MRSLPRTHSIPPAPAAALRALPLAWLALACVACGGDDTQPPGDDTTTVDDTAALDDAADDVVPALPDGNTSFLPEITRQPEPIGGVCQVDDDCTTNYCNTRPSGGYCTQRCNSTDNPCPSGSTCIQEIDSDGVKRGLCLRMCIANSGCRSDQFCPSEAKFCIPRCQVDTCNEGYVCNQLSGRCVPEAPCQPEPEQCDGVDQDCNGYIDEGCGPAIVRPDHVRVRDFGAIDIGGGGLSRTILMNIAADVASFSVVVVPVDHPESLVILYELRDSTGRNLIGAENPLEGAVPTYPSMTAYTLLVPNTDTFGSVAGRYTFSIAAYGAELSGPAPAGKAWVYVFENVRQAPAKSKLDLNMFFVGIQGLTATTAATDQRFQSLVSRLRTVLGNAAVTLGEVRYFDIDGVDADRYRIVDTGDGWEVDEHAELLALTERLAVDNTGVSVFFVQGFTGWGLLGKAGGVPGAALHHGAYNSGVVVSMVEYRNSPNREYGVQATADTIAHELGHQLGLFHTTESNGKSFDPISDTAECPAAQFDGNRDGLVDTQECAARDATNLMFWTSAYDSRLSVGQRKVLHGNPWLGNE
jgi:hypothetical protein